MLALFSTYQEAEELMRKKENRLPEGCTAKQMATRIRTFTTSINPHLDRPYVGDAIGKCIGAARRPRVRQAQAPWGG